MHVKFRFPCIFLLFSPHLVIVWDQSGSLPQTPEWYQATLTCPLESVGGCRALSELFHNSVYPPCGVEYRVYLSCVLEEEEQTDDWELDTLESLKVWPVVGLVTLVVEMLLPRPLSVLVVECRQPELAPDPTVTLLETES